MKKLILFVIAIIFYAIAIIAKPLKKEQPATAQSTSNVATYKAFE